MSLSSWRAILTGLGVTLSIPIVYLVLPFAIAIAAGLALGIDRLFYTPLRSRGAKPVTLLIASIGVTMMLQGLIRLFFGTGTYTFYEETSEGDLPDPPADRGRARARSPSPSRRWCWWC